MSRLVVSRRLTSYEVTLDLLKSIETYLLQKIPTILDLDSDTLKQGYSVSVTDDVGTERFASLKDFGLTLFRDYTESVEMSIWCREPNVLLAIR